MRNNGKFAWSVFLIICINHPWLFAQQKADSLINSLSGLSDTIKIQRLNVLAVQNFARDVNIAKRLAEESLSLSQKNTYSIGEAEALRIIGNVNSRQGQFAVALDFLEKSNSIFSRINNQNGIADVHNNKGLVYLQQGQYPLALENFTTAVKIWQQLNRKERIAPTIENIGMVYFRQEDYKSALNSFNESLALYKQQGNENSATKILVNLGATYNRLNMPDKALQAHLESLKYFEKTNSMIGMGIANNNIGNVYTATKNYKKALTSFEKSYEIKTKLGDKPGISITVRNMAEAYMYLGNFDKAKSCIDQSLKIAEEVGAKEQIKDAYDLLAKIYEKVKDFEHAYAYEKKLSLEKDSLFSVERTEQIARMRALYETEKAENEVLVLSKENELKDVQQRYLMLVAISLSLLVLVIIYFYWQKRVHNKLLTEKNILIEKSLHERESLLKEIHHRVKNNLQIISSLLSLQSKSLEDNSALNAISESRNRVKSMSLIHEQLYQEDTMSGVKMNEYLERLVSSLTSSYGIDSDKVQVKIESDNLLLDVDTAIPLGLIVNELVSNSMKYAFPNSGKGTILIQLKEMMNELKLVVEDTGIGMNQENTNAQSFGLNMVKSLMRKLKAEMNIMASAASTAGQGTSIELTIRDFKKVSFT